MRFVNDFFKKYFAAWVAQKAQPMKRKRKYPACAVNVIW